MDLLWFCSYVCVNIDRGVSDCECGLWLSVILCVLSRCLSEGCVDGCFNE